MNYVAALTLPELVPILGIFATMLGGFWAVLQSTNKSAGDERKADRAERQELSKAFNRVADATERSAREAEQRNGHLAELIIESKKDTMRIIKNLPNQEIHEQHVDVQVVEKKRSPKKK